MIKILVQYQGSDYPTIETGLREATRLIKETGIDVEIILRQSNLKLSTVKEGNVVFVDPQIIIGSTDVACNISCLIYDWKGLTPQPTNPVQTPQFIRGFTPIQIPMQWYTDTTVTPFKHYPEVLTHYFIHEVAHAITFLCNTKGLGIKDTVHDVMTIPAYLNIIKSLLPYKYAFSTAEKPVTIKQTTFGIGARGEMVRELQTFLGIKADGIFGRGTRQAVIDFQAKNRLVADGVIGKKTLAVIDSLKKKPKLDLSKWNLLPETEEKARKFLELSGKSGYLLKITSGRRTQAEQDKLYAQGRTTPGKIVTWTRKSNHITGKAFDIAFIGKEPYPKNFDWKILGDIGKSVGLKWGGDWKTKDLPHFEI
jgi:peptidoglycan L-alanyl-D-glutamate endopeptidase CwlK